MGAADERNLFDEVLRVVREAQPRAVMLENVRGLLADAPPPKGFVGMPRLTVRMVARIQGFPDDWRFWGRKTTTYRQVGNAFLPAVAQAVGEAIHAALDMWEVERISEE